MKISAFFVTVFTSNLLLMSLLGAEQGKNMKTLYTFNEGEKATRWFAVNDGVMGGLSKGAPQMSAGNLVFKGLLSLENNGGFSSIRSRQDMDLSGKTHIVLRVKGDGRKYQLRMATDARYRNSAISYGEEFQTKKDEWITVEIPLAKLSPSWRGRRLKGPEFDSSKVEELAILIGDKVAGDFKLEIDWISAHTISTAIAD